MPNGMEPSGKVSIPIPGTPGNWMQGLIAAAVMAFMGVHGVNLNKVEGNQEDSEKAVATIIEKIDVVTTDADKTRRDFMKQMKTVLEQQEEILAALRRLEGAE